MNSTLLSRVKHKLNSEFYFMNNDWFEGCLEYYINNHENAEEGEIINFVKSQWLLSDLREINSEKGCLPPNLSQFKVTTLPGTYLLQMEKIYDSAVSKYKRLEQIRKVSTANLEATEENEKQSAAPTQKGMLYLHLTDGIQNITAMEYKNVTWLNDELLPGLKVAITGPIQCRRGVLLLENGKIDKLGGEVDNLLIPNALENVLARALGLPENPDPYRPENEESNNENNDNTNTKDLFEDEFEIDLATISEIEQGHREVEIHSPSRNLNVLNVNQDSSSAHFRRENINEVINLDDDDIFEVFPENDLNFSITQSSTNSPNRGDRPCSSSVNQQVANEYLPEEVFADDFNVSDIEIIMDDPPKETVLKIDNQTTNAVQMNANAEKSMKSNLISNKISCTKNRKCSTTATSPLKTSIIESDKKEIVSVTKFLQDSLNESDKNNLSGIKKQEGFVTSPSTSMPKKKLSQENSKHDKGTRKISDFIQKIATPSKPDPPKICDFLCDLVINNLTGTFRTIRGQTAWLGKLSKENQCWQLDAVITDRTASLDVTFSSHVLEELIGRSVKQFSEEKKLAKGNPTMNEELRKHFRNVQAKLERLDALLELEFGEPNAKPKVVKITALTNQQKEIIDKRLEMLKT